MNRLIFTLAFISLCLAPVSAQIINKSITGLSFSSNEFSINCKSDTIWGRLNTPTTLAEIMGMNLRGGSKKLVEVGNAATMTTEHDTGAIIMTYRKGRNEIRFIFEPDSGTFLFQDIWKLNQVGANQTRVTFERRYVRPVTIPSNQISDLVRFLQDAIIRLKEMVEKK
jgi:hypothetical protein